MTSAAPRARLVPFPKTARLRQRADFSRVFEIGRRVASPALALHWLPAPGARFGIAVSRKVDPNAVGRNRIKRVLRESFRAHRSRLKPADYVIVARPPAAMLDNAALRIAFAQLLQRADALPLSTPAGTMRPACEPTTTPPSMPGSNSG